MHNSSIVIVENIWAEDLFEWFYNHIDSSGGDGASAIVCENYSETADNFIKWWTKEHLPSCKERGYKLNEFFHPRDEYHNIINYHDNNENYIFTNDTNCRLMHHDYVFLVKKDCKSAFDNYVIKAIK